MLKGESGKVTWDKIEECVYTHASGLRALLAPHDCNELLGITPDYLRELRYHDRKTLHNFKYFTWVEQQGRTVEELRQLWDRDFWTEIFGVTEIWDRRIEEFNERVGL